MNIKWFSRLAFVVMMVSPALALADQRHSHTSRPSGEQTSNVVRPTGHLALFSIDGKLKDRDLATGEIRERFVEKYFPEFWSLAHMDGTPHGVLALKGEKGSVYRLEPGGLPVELPLDCAVWSDVWISPDGSRVACDWIKISDDTGKRRGFSVLSQHEVVSIEVTGTYEVNDFTPDGRLVFTLPEGGYIGGIQHDPGVYVTSRNIKQVASLAVPVRKDPQRGGSFESASVSANGQLLVKYLSDFWLMQLDLSNPEIASVKGSAVRIEGKMLWRKPRISPDGKWFAVHLVGRGYFKYYYVILVSIDGKTTIQLQNGNDRVAVNIPVVWYN